MLRNLVRRTGFDVVRRHTANETLTDHLRNVFERYRIEAVLDVGANAGQYGRTVRETGFKGPIVSFEPVSAAFEALTQAAAGDAGWTCLPLALGSTSERRSISVSAGSVFSSFHAPSDYARRIWTGTAERGRETVEVRRLDELMPELRRTTGASGFFLKMDTQGHDLEVFAGAAEALESIPALQAELSMIPVYDGVPTAMDAIGVFGAAGYAISGLYPINRDESLAVVEYDGVFVRR